MATDTSAVPNDLPAAAPVDYVIVCPGGGYVGYAENEAEPVVAWLRQLGLSASAFRYPVHSRHPAPVDAVLAEVARIRGTGARRVALMGFSAGGHVAGHAALTGTGHERVDAAVLCYPVVSMEIDAHEGSRRELLGDPSSAEERAAASLEQLVTADAPPFFLWHTADDPSVSVRHSYLLAEALSKHEVSHALHVFPEGEHGLGLAAGSGEPEAWTALCAAWLAAQGWLETKKAGPRGG
ncbi:alpha/beta hydrolase [Cellulosimicrobium funkei]|nr:alpha/beta hydrolase [Cellulosimicrobium funkei]